MKDSNKMLIIMFIIIMILIIGLWKVNIEADRYAEAVENQKDYISDIELNRLELNRKLDKLRIENLQYEIGQTVKYMKVEATAYCPCSMCCGEYADGYTATGTVATEGRTVAVDPEVIPLGSRIWIPELNMILIAEDTGSAIKEYTIDIFMNSHSEALKFGRQELEIYVLE